MVLTISIISVTLIFPVSQAFIEVGDFIVEDAVHCHHHVGHTHTSVMVHIAHLKLGLLLWPECRKVVKTIIWVGQIYYPPPVHGTVKVALGDCYSMTIRVYL